MEPGSGRAFADNRGHEAGDSLSGGHGLALGVALANTNATQTANVTEVIRDQNGNQLSSRTLTLAPLNHTAFNPTFPSNSTAGGVVEYDANVNLFGLGIRSAPQGSGAGIHVGGCGSAAGGIDKNDFAHCGRRGLADEHRAGEHGHGARAIHSELLDGCRSVLCAASGVGCFDGDDTGRRVDDHRDGRHSIHTGRGVGAGDEQSVGGRNGDLPLRSMEPGSGGAAADERRGSAGDSLSGGNGLALGVALANPSATQTANITEVIRDNNGNQLSSRTLTLAPQNHTAFNPTFPSNTTGGGVVEYDSNTSLYGLGIRSAPEGSGLAFTSVRAVL